MASEVSRVETVKAQRTQCLEIVARKSMSVVLWDASPCFLPIGLPPFPPDGVNVRSHQNTCVGKS